MIGVAPLPLIKQKPHSGGFTQYRGEREADRALLPRLRHPLTNEFGYCATLDICLSWIRGGSRAILHHYTVVVHLCWQRER
jgi:hypothetical protein